MKHQKIEIIYGNIKFICFEFLNYINKIKLTTKRTSLLPKHKTAWYLNSCGPSGPPYSCLFWWLLLMATPLNSYSFCNVYNSVWVITWLRLFSDNCIVYKNKKNVSEKNSVFIALLSQWKSVSLSSLSRIVFHEVGPLNETEYFVFLRNTSW